MLVPPDFRSAVTSVYLESKALARSALPDRGGTRELASPMLARMSYDLGALPLVSAGACGGELRELRPATAAWLLTQLIVRVLDDLQDGDRPGALYVRIGAARAYNFCCQLFVAAVGLLVSTAGAADYLATLEQLLYGQGKDLQGKVGEDAAQWQLVREKNGSLFAWGASVAAGEYRSALVVYGRELGTVYQVFDDLEGAYFPPRHSELATGKYTLVQATAARIGVDPTAPYGRAAVVEELVSRALGHAEAGHSALESLPENEGTAALRALIRRPFKLIGGPTGSSNRDAGRHS